MEFRHLPFFLVSRLYLAGRDDQRIEDAIDSAV